MANYTDAGDLSLWLGQPTLKLLKYIETLAFAVCLPVVLVMYGWIFNIEIVKVFLPGQMPMKFLTAVLFFLCGLSLFFIAQVIKGKREVAQVVLPATSITVLLLITAVVCGALIQVETGVESLFVGVLSDTTGSGVSQMPPLPEIFVFTAMAIIGILTLFKLRYLRFIVFFSGILTTLSGLLAIIGLFLKVQQLNFKLFGDIGYPLVFSSALIFLVLGISLILLGKIINNLSAYPYD